jgi:hypothetical protein
MRLNQLKFSPARGAHGPPVAYFPAIFASYFPEARWASGPQDLPGWLEFDCASIAQNALCENQFDHFASERRAERRNAVLPSREPLRYSESSLRRRCLTTSTVSTCALDRAAGERCCKRVHSLPFSSDLSDSPLPSSVQARSQLQIERLGLQIIPASSSAGVRWKAADQGASLFQPMCGSDRPQRSSPRIGRPGGSSAAV